MANEPERPIEKLLCAAAKKRRDEAGAPLELHPATRRLLQGEVARKYAKPGRGPRSFPEVLRQLWPRFAWAVATLAVLAAGLYMLIQPRPWKQGELAQSSSLALKRTLSPPGGERDSERGPTPVPQSAPAPAAGSEGLTPAATPDKDNSAALLAKNEPVPQAMHAKEPPPALPAAESAAPAPSAPAAVANSAAFAFADKAQAAHRDSTPELALAGKPAPPADMTAPPASPAPVAAPPAAGAAVAMNELASMANREAGQSALAYKDLAAAASANRPQSPSVATDGLFKSAAQPRQEAGSINVTQRFAQAAPGPKAKAALAGQSAPAQPVLAAFQVEQTGSELRIVDGDGSVYTGTFQLADVARHARSAKTEAPVAARTFRATEGMLAEKPVPSLDSDQLAPQTYSFRVAGTNRSLNQQVVFTGSLQATTNLALTTPVTTNLSIGGGLGGSQTRLPQQVLLPLLQSRISGQVVIGTSKPVEINALPASP